MSVAIVGGIIVFTFIAIIVYFCIKSMSNLADEKSSIDFSDDGMIPDYIEDDLKNENSFHPIGGGSVGTTGNWTSTVVYNDDSPLLDLEEYEVKPKKKAKVSSKKKATKKKTSTKKKVSKTKK